MLATFSWAFWVAFGCLPVFTIARQGSSEGMGQGLLFPWLTSPGSQHPPPAGLPGAAAARGVAPHRVPVRRSPLGRSLQEDLALLEETDSLGPGASASGPMGERQELIEAANMGHFVAQYAATKEREATLQRQLLDEAAKARAADARAAEAQQRADERERFFEGGFLTFAGLAGFAFASALLYSPKRKPGTASAAAAPEKGQRGQDLPEDRSRENGGVEPAPPAALAAPERTERTSSTDQEEPADETDAIARVEEGGMPDSGFQAKVARAADALRTVEENADEAALNLAAAKCALTALEAASEAASSVEASSEPGQSSTASSSHSSPEGPGRHPREDEEVSGLDPAEGACPAPRMPCAGTGEATTPRSEDLDLSPRKSSEAPTQLTQDTVSSGRCEYFVFDEGDDDLEVEEAVAVEEAVLLAPPLEQDAAEEELLGPLCAQEETSPRRSEESGAASGPCAAEGGGPVVTALSWATAAAAAATEDEEDAWWGSPPRKETASTQDSFSPLQQTPSEAASASEAASEEGHLAACPGTSPRGGGTWNGPADAQNSDVAVEPEKELGNSKS